MDKTTRYFIGTLLDASKSDSNVMQFKKHGSVYFCRVGNSSRPWNLKKAKRVIPVHNLTVELTKAKEEMRSRGLTVPGIVVE